MSACNENRVKNGIVYFNLKSRFVINVHLYNNRNRSWIHLHFINVITINTFISSDFDTAEKRNSNYNDKDKISPNLP